MQECTLCDVVYHAPRLHQLLSQQSKLALAACSKQLYQLVRKQIKILFVHSTNHLDAIAQGYWPQLMLISLCGAESASSIHWQAKHPLQLVTALDLSQNDSTSAFLIVRARSSEPCRSQAGQQISAAMSYLQSFQHADVRKAAFYNSSVARACTAKLSAMQWPNLTSVALVNCKLGALAVAYLVKGSWPALHTLNLHGNLLGGTAMRVLAQGNWPVLDTLDLSCESNLDAEAAEALVMASLPELSHLNLTNNKLDTEAACFLSWGEWPKLTYISLSRNRLDDTALMHIAEAGWPQLSQLNLSYNTASATGIMCLPRGPWQELSWLCVDKGTLTPDVCAMFSMYLDGLSHHACTCNALKSMIRYIDHPTGCEPMWPKMRVVHAVP